MEFVREENRRSIREELDSIKDELKLQKMKEKTEEFQNSKEGKFKLPFKWKSKIKKGKKKSNRKNVVVVFLNKKGEVEEPTICPVFYGNIILKNNVPYEFDPRAVWIWWIRNKPYKVIIIKEIDRRPVSNLDLDEIKKRGDATDSDEFLIKTALRAIQKEQVKQAAKWILILIGIAIVGAVIYFFMR